MQFASQRDSGPPSGPEAGALAAPPAPNKGARVAQDVTPERGGGRQRGEQLAQSPSKFRDARRFFAAGKPLNAGGAKPRELAACWGVDSRNYFAELEPARGFRSSLWAKG